MTIQTANISTYFEKGYIAEPYWPEMARLIDIQKQSGMNRAKSSANRRKALEEHLQGLGMSFADYEALEKKAREPFYRTADGEIVMPQHQVESFLANTCHEARHQTRPCEADQVRSRFICSPWSTGKFQEDGVYERFVVVTGGMGGKLSNQRSLRSSKYISDFTATGSIKFDPDFVDPPTLRRALEWGGQFVGIGASRKMGWGRFALKKFALNALHEVEARAAE
jgi:hypothetical protein